MYIVSVYVQDTSFGSRKTPFVCSSLSGICMGIQDSGYIRIEKYAYIRGK